MRLYEIEGSSESNSKPFEVNSMKKGQADLRNRVKQKATNSDQSVHSAFQSTGKFGRTLPHVHGTGSKKKGRIQ